MDLEFATTDELASELICRATFVGAVIHSTTEHRSPNTVHANFQISTNMSDEDLSTLLGYAVESIRNGTYRKIVKD
jgi:hypothetical protein